MSNKEKIIIYILSSNIIDNSAKIKSQLPYLVVHFLVIFLVAKYKHFINESSVGNTALVLVYFLNYLFNDSIVLVVYIIFLIESE